MDLNNVNEILKKKGYKFTPQRKAILEVVSEKFGEHLSSEEIYDLVKVKILKLVWQQCIEPFNF